MDETKYEKIEGGFLEALNLMDDGVTVCDHHGQEYVLNPYNGLQFADQNGEFRLTQARFNELSSRKWYKKKPFDVRKAMLERPNEWVGAFRGESGSWYKVGFDKNEFRAVFVGLKNNLNVIYKLGYSTKMADSYDLNRCIPIEDVPEEARR